MEQLLFEYNQNLNLYVQNRLLGLPLSLKLFDLRFRLANSINYLAYNTNIFPFDNEGIRQSYTKMIKLMEFWYAYEALIKFIRPPEINNREVKYNTISRRIINDAGCNDIFNDFHPILQKRCNNENFMLDLQRLIEIITNDISLGQTVKTDCKRLFSSLNQNRITLTNLEIMALIYAERNMYIHSGLTAIGGMRPPNRVWLLNFYIEYLSQHTIKLATHIIGLRIQEDNI
jgi:hypothetical protein